MSHRYAVIRVAGGFLAFAVAFSGCVTTVKLNRAELERLRLAGDIHIVHYESPSFRVVRKQPAAAAALAFGVVGVVVAAAVIHAAQVAEGQDVIRDYGLEDPTLTVKARLVETLAKEAGLANVKLVEATAASDRQAELKETFGASTILDLKPLGWSLSYQPSDSDVYVVSYLARGRLLRLEDGRVLWEGYCHPHRHWIEPYPALMEDLKAGGGLELRARLRAAATGCADDLVTQIVRGDTSAVIGPGHGPQFYQWPDAADVKLDSIPLAGIRPRLLGEEGPLPAGKRFEAKFQQVTLTGADMTALHDLIREALALPPASELKIDGTVDGAPLKVKIDRNKAGRTEVELDGLAFADQEQLTTFVAAFKRPELKELDLKARVGDQPVRVHLGPKGAAKPSAGEKPAAGETPGTAEKPGSWAGDGRSLGPRG